MARLEFQDHIVTDDQEIQTHMQQCGIPYERWGVRTQAGARDEDILDLFQDEVNHLKAKRGYVTADLVALSPATPNLEDLLAKFDKEHHHLEDEVRFTVEGEGVFEIEADDGAWLKFTAEPGDLIVIPAHRRHLFYLTEKKTIRCIRLFKTQEGWSAIYDQEARQ